MDSFGFAVGFSGVDPRYFWFDMDFRELESLVPYYREGWEKTRIVVQTLTGEKMPMPWDEEIAAADKAKLQKEYEATIALRAKRQAAAAKLSEMFIVINTQPETRNP